MDFVFMIGKVVVLGSINQDLIAVCQTHPDRGETVRGLGLLRVPGGKGANQVVAASSAGVKAVIIGAVGSDTAGTELIEFLKSRNVDTDHIRVDALATGMASIFVDMHGEISIVAIAGANEKVVDDASVVLQREDVLVAPLEVPTESIVSFFQRGRQAGCRTILNASPAGSIPRELVPLIDICVVNEFELTALIGVKASILATATEVIEAARSVELTADATVIVPLREFGTLVVRRDDHTHIKGAPVKVVDVTGAEDCFVGSLAARLAEGTSLDHAVEYANRAAVISLKRRGAASSMPTKAEVNDLANT